MLILGLLGMYFDAAVVFVTNSSFFRLTVAVLCCRVSFWDATCEASIKPGISGKSLYVKSVLYLLDVIRIFG